MPYPNPYAGLQAGVTSAGNSIAETLRKLEEQKKQEEWMAKLKAYISGQDPSATPTVTDWGSNVTAPGQAAGTLPQPQAYGQGQGQYGSPVDWTKWVEPSAGDWSSNVAQGTGAAAAGGNKGGGGAGANKGGG